MTRSPEAKRDQLQNEVEALLDKEAAIHHTLHTEWAVANNHEQLGIVSELFDVTCQLKVRLAMLIAAQREYELSSVESDA